MSHRKIAIGVGGASGARYAKLLFDRLVELDNQWERVGVVFSANAYTNWELELGARFEKHQYPFDFYEQKDFMAPFASGSANYDCLTIIPCSMGLLGRVANGVSSDLMTRAADVMLKERKQLILSVRETPYNLIHIQNMERVTLAGGLILPATPSLYSAPKTIDELLLTVVDRILDRMGFDVSSYRWSS